LIEETHLSKVVSHARERATLMEKVEEGITGGPVSRHAEYAYNKGTGPKLT
jgi:hypothetical protein